MTINRNVLLLSIRPKFAELILAGEKTVELRRVRPRIIAGDKVLMYVSAPTMTLLGTVEVGNVTDGAPSSIWRKVRGAAGVTKKEFDSYFESATRAVAIAVRRPRLLPNPIGLEELKELFEGFHPPQSFRYLNQSQMNILGVSA